MEWSVAALSFPHQHLLRSVFIMNRISCAVGDQVAAWICGGSGRSRGFRAGSVHGRGCVLSLCDPHTGVTELKMEAESSGGDHRGNRVTHRRAKFRCTFTQRCTYTKGTGAKKQRLADPQTWVRVQTQGHTYKQIQEGKH